MMKEEAGAVLEVRRLSITFAPGKGKKGGSQLTAVRDLSFGARKGEVLAVVGSSGSGKSLLAHSVLGILPQNASLKGEMEFLGETLTPRRKSLLRGKEIALVPQNVSCLDPLMKVGEQIRGGKKDGESHRKSLETLARYGLGPETEKLFPFQLSGGMARRVLISTAAMELPKLVIADEPTPGLDAKTAKRVLNHFREMADQGAAVLLITHDLEMALEISDRILVLYGGMEVEEAGAEDFEREETLRHPYTKALYRAMPRNGFQCVGESRINNGEGPPKACVYWSGCEFADSGCKSPVAVREWRGGRVRCVHPE